MTDALRFYGEINLQKIVDEQARKLQRNVDEATLDKAADTLATFGYVKADAELGRCVMISETESLLWELVGALDVADATEADKKPIVAEYARRIPVTLGIGTCRNQWEWNSGFCCSECFYTVQFVGKFVSKPFKYCPNCRKEVER